MNNEHVDLPAAPSAPPIIHPSLHDVCTGSSALKGSSFLVDVAAAGGIIHAPASVIRCMEASHPGTPRKRMVGRVTRVVRGSQSHFSSHRLVSDHHGD